jgi:two-component system cell cycle response regulator
LDVDHFKSINDKFGHPGGDEVLRHVAYRIRDVIRSIDIPGRFGGEEFVVILPNTNSGDAFAIAERVRKGISSEPFKLEDENKAIQKVSITISIGISCIEKGETDEEVYRTADTALYQAKNEGRDRTVLFEQIETIQ